MPNADKHFYATLQNPHWLAKPQLETLHMMILHKAAVIRSLPSTAGNKGSLVNKPLHQVVPKQG